MVYVLLYGDLHYEKKHPEINEQLALDLIKLLDNANITEGKENPLTY
jgi:hypothetical protein